jgi:hypothetical protein
LREASILFFSSSFLLQQTSFFFSFEISSLISANGKRQYL